MMRGDNSVQISAIVPVGDRQSPVEDLYLQYKEGLSALDVPYELIFVLDGPRPQFALGLEKLAANGERFTVVTLTRSFGEATALMVGFEHASAPIIVTLPAYLQIVSSEIRKLVGALDSADVAVGHRHPRAGGWLEGVRRRTFHGLLGGITGVKFQDLGCSARALRRKVLEEIPLYGDQQRFLPVLADRQGFKVREVNVQQSDYDRRTSAYRPRTYARGFLDIFTVFFLVRFTKKPLRFFGMIGVITFMLGALTLLYLVVQRAFFSMPLADRPAMLLSSLLVVLGIQIFALGLLGELIIFTHAGNIKGYQVERVIQYPDNVVTARALPGPGEARQQYISGV
jgi:glycosyltransferase involved in cell wall biosynthesis